MAEKLTLEEQETVITFDKTPNPAVIFTYEKTWQKILEKKLGIKPTMVNGLGGREYKIDKKRIRPPRAPVKMSPEAKKKRSERAKQLHKARRK